jgi:RNA polymerase sigma-70 factor, ECF subfamily
MARDEDALREVMSTHGSAVFGMAKRIIADANWAEEVAQDTFIALWRRPGSFDPGRGSLRTFLLGVARNKSVDLVRKESRIRRNVDEIIVQTQDRDEEVTLDASDERAEVRSAMKSLTDVQREAIVLAYFGGYTYREVAIHLDIPEGTAKSRLRDALLRMRRALGQGTG